MSMTDKCGGGKPKDKLLSKMALKGAARGGGSSGGGMQGKGVSAGNLTPRRDKPKVM